MEYITHHRFKELALCGERLNIPYGTALEARGGILTTHDGRAVCYKTSENAKLHFARDDDGRGLERGKLAYAVAYGRRGPEGGPRFSVEERGMLAREWAHFLRRDTDALLFNEDFFSADVEELQKLADALNKRTGR